jgi:periplasmic protein TonB
MTRFVVGILLIAACGVSAVAQVVAPLRVRVAENVMQGMLVKKVDPQRPSGDAANMRGEVVFKAVIGKDGDVENLQAVSGHPLLIPPAIEAVKQWKYKPYLLNGEPVIVETTIRVRVHKGKKSSPKPESLNEK